VTSDRFYKSLPDFIELCNILSGDAVQPGVFAPADALECAWGITEALLLSPPDDDDEEPFVPDIRGYIGEVAKSEGLLSLPDILRIGIQDEDWRARVNYEFSDDPIMFDSIYQAEAGKVEEINSIIGARLSMLVRQVEALPLKNGNASKLARGMLSTAGKAGVTSRQSLLI